IKLWTIPDNCTTITTCTLEMRGHVKKIGRIEWHPIARGVLLSAGHDGKCILWNTELGEKVITLSLHRDVIFSISWCPDGRYFASTCKDKTIRVIDPRSGVVVSQGEGHLGTKSSKVIFVDDKRLFTTGFSRMSERQFALWDIKNLSKPLKSENVDSSSGILLPYYDKDTKVMFLAGKGDGNIRFYEITDLPPYVFYLQQFQSGFPQRGLGQMPKRGVDVKRCEIVRFFKLHTNKDICEPISMIVPRKSEVFHEDIYPPTCSSLSSCLSASEWFGGVNKLPLLISLKVFN
ncbi:hypothetical protein HELRODRAFT_90303, partial [Helobdella robusta]|uniref:Coronin n=1 Tax=Helobdella robusta TaxID=6412 RepID=T1G7P0_HELRO